MHDVLPGTGVDEIYNEVRDIFENERKSMRNNDSLSSGAGDVNSISKKYMILRYWKHWGTFKI